MAISGKRRFDDDDKVVRYTTAENDFEVEVTRTLQKWCVTVYQLPNRDILAQDFIRLLNQRNKKENAEVEL